MPKVKVVKTTVKKKGTKKSGTVGGSSTKNFSIKYRNVDYKYRLVDVDDTYSDSVINRIVDVYRTNADIASYGTDGISALAEGLRNFCFFIPLSTTQLISRSMNVNIKCKYPFAYCVFQNTADFYKYIFQYVQTKNKNLTVNNQTRAFPYYFVGNAAQSPDSLLFMPCQRTNSEDAGYLSNATWSEGISVLFSQLCQKQSTYKEVYSATNSGLYTANVSVYYKKASQFLSGSLNNKVFSGYNAVQKVATTLEEMYTFSNNFNDIQKIQAIFRPGDMTLCVIPIYYFYNKMLDDTKLPTNNTYLYPLSFDIKRRVYRLNQDNGLQEAAERILNDRVTTITNTVTKVGQVATTANQGNNFNFNVTLRDFVQRCSQGVLGRPKILRSDLDSAGSNCNCVIVDQNCYDPNTETLQMQAYMDLQAVPTAAGTSTLNNFEDEDTFNCNVITQAANVDFEQTNQIVTLPNVVGGPLGDATSESIQQTNTGPTLVQIVAQPYVIDSYDSTNTFDPNLCYNLGYYQYINNCVTNHTQLTLGAVENGGVAAVNYLDNLDLGGESVEILESWKLAFLGYAEKLHLRITIYRADSLQASADVSDPTKLRLSMGFSMTTDYLANQAYVTTIGYTPTNADGKRAVLDIAVFLAAGVITPGGLQQQVLAIGPGCLICDNNQYPFNARQTLELTSTQYYAFISLLTQPMFLVRNIQTSEVKYLTLNDMMMTVDDGRQYPNPSFFNSVVYESDVSLTAEPSPILVANYLYDWVNIYHRIFVSSKEGWKRFKGFLGKCWKWIKNAIPKGKKIINAIAPFVPAPYSTAVVAVADKVDNIVTNLDTIAVKKTSSTLSAAVLDDEEDDVFVVTPQYRLSTSDEPADIGATGDDWIDGESYEQPCNAYGVQTLKTVRFDFTKHPVYGEYFRNRRLGLTLGDASTIHCQQRLKVTFRKRCSQAVAQAYKAILTLGSDTNYLTPDDYQVQE